MSSYPEKLNEIVSIKFHSGTVFSWLVSILWNCVCLNPVQFTVNLLCGKLDPTKSSLSDLSQTISVLLN